MNTISIAVNGGTPAVSSANTGSPVTVALVVPNGEEEGMGINVSATLTPTMEGATQHWLVRTENAGDACAVKVSARVSSPIIVAGNPITMTNRRGDTATRQTTLGNQRMLPHVAVTPGETDRVFVDVATFDLDESGALEFSASVQ